MSADSISPHLRLGRQCRDLRRFADAERHFKDALASNPRDDSALHELALTLYLQEGREKEALEMIDHAIAIDPNDAEHHAARGFILNNLDRHKEALAAAREARRLNPYSSSALIAEAQAHMMRRDWADAERVAREALAIDADNSSAANLLAHALRMQSKTAENDAQIAGLLARDPDDAVTHLNAGWSALNRSDYRAAEVHFREALRLEPELDAARQGLLTSFRARSPVYRGYLAYSMWMARHKGVVQFAIIIGLLVGVRVLRTIAGSFSPLLATLIGSLYLLFVVFSFVADAVGNFILLTDRFARHALRPAEKREALFVGGGVTLGVLLAVGGALSRHGLSIVLLGSALLIAGIPFSMVFTNKSRIGTILFASVGSLTLLGAVLVMANHPVGFAVLLVGLLGSLLSAWVSGVTALNRK